MSGVTATVSDHVPVGTVEILSSPHVTEGPGRIMRAPVPSIYQDDRGDIHRLRVGGQRINLLYSVRGVMRSGYLFPHAMHDTVISGRVEVWRLQEEGTVKTVYKQYQHFTIAPYVPHILHFLEDSVICEWWHTPDFQCWYYHPYRKIIDIQNSLMAQKNQYTVGSNSTGRHQRLIPQDEASLLDPNTSYWSTLVRWGCATILISLASAAAGLVAGIALSAALGETNTTTGSSGIIITPTANRPPTAADS